MSAKHNTEVKRKALFIVGSTAQAEMFAQVSKHLIGWDVKAINTDKVGHQTEMEQVLKELNFSFFTIASAETDYIDNLLANEQPDIAVFGHDRWDLDKLFIKVANSRNIPTLLVQDGALTAGREKSRETGNITNSLRYWFSAPLRTFLFLVRDDRSFMKKVEITLFELRHGNRGKLGVYGHGECTKMAVFGDAIKKMFVSEGIDPERIVVTGNPKFDRLFYPGSKNSKEKVCQQWGIPQNNDIIVLFTQYLVEAGIWTPEQRRRFVLAIAQAVEKLPGTQLIIKLHPPHEKESDYHEIIQELSHKPIIIKYTNLPEMINACSLAITVDSTAGLEAMTVGKPLLIVDLQKRSEPSFYMGSGALFAYTVNDILPAMQKALYDEQTYKEMSELASRFVYNQTYLQDGQAAKRIADLITNMVINKHMAVVTR